mmetsp:Transcript_25070/g.71395  ORF Transcript_25070/g.71395 Transcript_25070/m.71395 type:complete len:209 (+) Transcript_25070:39-665(+)
MPFVACRQQPRSPHNHTQGTDRHVKHCRMRNAELHSMIGVCCKKSELANASLAPDAQIQVPLVAQDRVEATRDQLVLLDDLANVGALDELQRLRVAIRQRLGRLHQGLALVRAVPEGENVLGLGGVVQGREPIEAFDLDLKGTHFPIQRRRRARALVGRPRRNHPDVLKHWVESWQKLLATQLYPAPLGVGDHHDSPMLLGQSQRLGC